MVEYPFFFFLNGSTRVSPLPSKTLLLEFHLYVGSLDNPVSSSIFLNRAFTFDSVQSAQRAKASLNGADIYSGCCTLKIEYAKVTLSTIAKEKMHFQNSTDPCFDFWKVFTESSGIMNKNHNFLCILQPTRLNVFKNDQDTWDYTNPNLGGPGKTFKNCFVFFF